MSTVSFYSVPATSDCGVSANTVKEYFSILEDTLVGYYLPAFAKTQKRRVVQAPKFYLFDVGLVNHLLHPRSLGAWHEGIWACL